MPEEAARAARPLEEYRDALGFDERARLLSIPSLFPR